MTNSQTEIATLAGGCFWGVEHYFKKQFGSKLISTTVGYAGGDEVQPAYEVVKTGTTKHAETVQIEYNPNEVTFEELLTYFWRIHDPTTLNQQVEDLGPQYRSAIFYHSEEQRRVAEEVKIKVQPNWGNPIVTEITNFVNFYDAEEYHQDYLDNNPTGWCVHKVYW
jgi:peptide-methionine (S)-S-oxide reductase